MITGLLGVIILMLGATTVYLHRAARELEHIRYHTHHTLVIAENLKYAQEDKRP